MACKINSWKHCRVEKKRIIPSSGLGEFLDNLCNIERPVAQFIHQVLTHNDHIPPNAIPFCEDADGSPLYIARVLLEVPYLLTYGYRSLTSMDFRAIFMSIMSQLVFHSTLLTLTTRHWQSWTQNTWSCSDVRRQRAHCMCSMYIPWPKSNCHAGIDHCV